MSPNPQKTEDLVTFTEETLNGKLDFLRGVHVYLSFIFPYLYLNYMNYNVSILRNSCCLKIFKVCLTILGHYALKG